MTILPADQTSAGSAGLADRIESHVRRLANTGMNIRLNEWCSISNDLLEAAAVLRAPAEASPKGLLSSDNPYNPGDMIEKWLDWDTAWHRLALAVSRSGTTDHTFNAAQSVQVSEALALADECEREFDYSRNRMVRAAKLLRALAGQPPAAPVETEDEETPWPVEIWHGDRKVSIYSDSVHRIWGPNMDTHMTDEPRTHETVGAAIDWLYAVQRLSAGCGDPNCKDPNCEYGKGPLRCQSCGAILPTEPQTSREPGEEHPVLKQCDELHDLGFHAGWTGAIEECAKFLAAEYPDNANTNAFCAAIRSLAVSRPKLCGGDK